MCVSYVLSKSTISVIRVRMALQTLCSKVQYANYTLCILLSSKVQNYIFHYNFVPFSAFASSAQMLHQEQIEEQQNKPLIDSDCRNFLLESHLLIDRENVLLLDVIGQGKEHVVNITIQVNIAVHNYWCYALCFNRLILMG